MPSFVPILFVLALATILRLGALEPRSLWFDETLSWRLAHHPLRDLPSALSISPHPPTYFLLLRVWVRVFGDTPGAVRGLSVVAGVAAVLGIYLLVKRLLKDDPGAVRTAVFAAALMALSPFQIRYSVEARMYAVLAAGAVWTSWLLLRALDSTSDTRWRYWLTYGGFTIPFVYTHYFAYFTVACQAVYVLWLLLEEAPDARWWRIHRRPTFKPSATAFLMIGIALLPWASFVVTHLTSGSGVREWQSSLTSRGQVFAIVAKLLVDPEASPTDVQSARVTLLVGVTFFLLSVRRIPRAGFITALAIGPILLMVAAAAAGAKLLIARYLAGAQPFLLVAIAVVATSRLQPPRAQFLGLLIVIASGWLCADAWGPATWQGKPNYRGAAEFVAEHRSPDDAILAANGFVYLPFHFHSPDRRNLFVAAPDPGTFLDGQHLMIDQEMASSEQILSWQGRTVWAIHSVETGGDRRTVVLPPVWSEVGRWSFTDAQYGGVEVVRYEPLSVSKNK